MSEFLAADEQHDPDLKVNEKPPPASNSGAGKQLGFSIAQIMGFIHKNDDNEKSSSHGDETDPEEEIKVDDEASHGSPAAAAAVWRPQPCRKYNLVQAAAAALAAQQQAFSGSQDLNNVTVPPTAPSMNSDLGASLLRHYSLFNPWKSSLLSSYTNLLGLHHLKSPFMPVGGSFSGANGSEQGYGTAAAAALMSSLTSNTQRNVPTNEIFGGNKDFRKSHCKPPSQPKIESSRPQAPPTSKAAASTNSNGQQKTFPCSECGKVFNAHYNLTRHMPVHTGKRLPSRSPARSLLVIFFD